MMRMYFKKTFKGILTVIIIATSFSFAEAKITMPRLFSNGMVLQQKSNVAIWGKSDKKNASISLVASWDKKRILTKSDNDGLFRFTITTPQYGETYQIDISDGDHLVIKDIIVGEVWLCSGQSNMDMRIGGRYGDGIRGALDAIVTSDNPLIRMFTAKVTFSGTPLDDLDGEWQAASTETTADFSATAYFFARKLNQVLHVPVGIIHLSCGGSKVEAWMSQESVAPYKHLKDVQNPSCLFDGMMNAAVGYGIRGCLWYQGEANVDSPDLYTQLFPTMVADWRQRWQQGDFPFYFAQIAPYNYRHKEGKGANSAYMREAQQKCLSLIPNSGMVVLSDIGQPYTIHPIDKQPVGERFAYLALHDTYGKQGVPESGPVYREMKIDGNRIELFFDHMGRGLTTYRQPFNDFEIAGEDHVFYPAWAGLGKDAQSIVVSSNKVAHPVAVRYGFKDYFQGCLYNMYGLPASSFRTDDW